jgi:hypothetical protein
MGQEVGIGIGHHIGRKRQRQHQQDLPQPHAGKPVHRHQPGRARADRRRAEAHEDHQQQRRAHVARQHRRHQPLPGRPVAGEGGERRRRDRRDADEGHDPGEQLQETFGHAAGGPRFPTVSDGNSPRRPRAQAAEAGRGRRPARGPGRDGATHSTYQICREYPPNMPQICRARIRQDRDARRRRPAYLLRGKITGAPARASCRIEGCQRNDR